MGRPKGSPNKEKPIGEVDPLEVAKLFDNRIEKEAAVTLLRKYLDEYIIENISDKNTLKQLIYLEILHYHRLQKTANNEFKDVKATSPNTVRAIHENLEQILKLKNSLSLIQPDKGKSDAYQALDTLFKKFKVWRENNQGSRTLVCPHCSKMVMLKIRTDAWEAQKHPFFKDKLLANEHLVELYRENKITDKDVAKILQVSPDYVYWLIDRWMGATTPKEPETPIEDKIEDGNKIEIVEDKIIEEVIIEPIIEPTVDINIGEK